KCQRRPPRPCRLREPQQRSAKLRILRNRLPCGEHLCARRLQRFDRLWTRTPELVLQLGCRVFLRLLPGRGVCGHLERFRQLRHRRCGVREGGTPRRRHVRAGAEIEPAADSERKTEGVPPPLVGYSESAQTLKPASTQPASPRSRHTGAQV